MLAFSKSQLPQGAEDVWYYEEVILWKERVFPSERSAFVTN